MSTDNTATYIFDYAVYTRSITALYLYTLCFKGFWSLFWPIYFIKRSSCVRKLLTFLFKSVLDISKTINLHNINSTTPVPRLTVTVLLLLHPLILDRGIEKCKKLLSNDTANYLQSQSIHCMSGLLHQLNRVKKINTKKYLKASKLLQ